MLQFVAHLVSWAYDGLDQKDAVPNNEYETNVADRAKQFGIVDMLVPQLMH